MNHDEEYVTAIANGEPLPVDTFFELETQVESVDNLITLYPNEEDRKQWQSS